MKSTLPLKANPLTIEDILKLLRQHRSELRRDFGVCRLAIFGSYARRKATAGSDVDILVEFDRPIGWEIVDLHAHLEDLLGVKIDILTPGALKRKPWHWSTIRDDLVDV